MTAVTPIGSQLASPSTETNVAMIERAVKIAIDALKELGMREDCMVLVGGGSLSEQSALAAGADAYCRNIQAPLNAAKTFASRR